MQTLQGIAVSPGVAIGEALVFDVEGFRIPRRFVAQEVIDQELARLRKSVDAVAVEIARNRDAVEQQLGAQYAAIFSAHLQMLRDPQLTQEVEEFIRQRHYSPEYAVSRCLRRYARVFQNLENTFLAERAHDIFDLEKRLLRNLLGRGREELAHLSSHVVVLAHDLTPGETASLDRRFVLGFVTEVGGPGGHTAIIAEAMELPAVVGVGAFLSDVSGGDLVIIDGHHGRVVIDPDPPTLADYRHQAEAHRVQAGRLAALRDLLTETRDGTRIELCANIEFPREVPACLARGADGIGLYRTEFLYLAAEHEPTEEDHYQAYAQVAREMGGRPVVIRTLDLGADKMGLQPAAGEEKNPFLGLRSIRLALRNLPLFRTQLRAILRASTLGDIRVMLPLISTLQELRQARAVLADVMEDLEEEGAAFNRQIRLGIMVEVPAAVIMLDRMIREVDFISIGSNDLIQYTLAVDRSNKDVAGLYSASDPSVLRLIQMAIQSAQQAAVPASLCGQMSGTPCYTMLLLGMGLRSMSVPPSAIPEIKRICRAVSEAHCRQVANRALGMDSAREVTLYLTEELRKIAPEFAET